ncbi:glycoside hydrolase family 97 catalytic domain-containing protein [Mucilaginibacter sp. Bleaf8]|uniref:glycoside hydrolase family 97 protein n=1 Tax=Mucilaginibacter sp. Bleaf8 TaxID=2834430 RepID=UPI001BD01071|nr:glycoside hydrolase family 97 protein [Mucilaginibacter sp. Bleaf8]MBS7566858.1 glycoside hydrolase family 97 catalytic domain-containing protein [Mucilaginibacter sp. Bleaf8]
MSKGVLQYKVLNKGQTVIEPSRMGLLVDSVEYGRSGALFPSKITNIQKRFAWRGVHNVASYHATSATVKVGGKYAGNDWTIDVQVFDEGVAFRYIIPHRGTATVTRELTSFTVPGQSEAWWQGDIQNYEGEYTKSKPSAIKKGQPVGLPFTLVLPQKQGYAAIAEADVNNYAGMHLQATGSNTFQTTLDGDVTLTGNMKTPWRIISIGQDLNALVNNDMIAALSPKPDPALFPKGFDTEWIKPGKSVWSWMTANRAVTPENMRKFSDMAARCDIPYNLVDDGWGKWREPGKDEWQILKELVDYSAAKNVKIWVWAAYPDNNGIRGLKDSVYLLSFFKKCRETGVAGVKIDFMSSESQSMVEFYNRASREAALQQLMIDFHGASKPSGQSRTWPNELSREAVRGLEYSDDTDWPTHNTIIPFTRYLAGHGDYTPLSTAKFVSSTTLAHQVATMITFTSPFLCLGVDPGDLLKSEALPFVRTIPSVWDKTVVLPPSAIGEVCVMARRSGTKWFLAVLNNKQAKKISVPLSFLGTKSFSCQPLGDKVITSRISGKAISGKSNIAIALNSGDGFVAVFERR